MKFLHLLKITAPVLAILSVATVGSAGVIGIFNGEVSSIGANLAADLAADPTNAPFGLGTAFSGDFLYKIKPDENNSPTIGSYSDPLVSLNLAGGGIVDSATVGAIRIKNNDPQNSNFRDEFRLRASGNNLSGTTYSINGTNWVLNRIEIIMRETSAVAPTILLNDQLPKPLPDSTNWESVRIRLRFRIVGQGGSSNQFVDIGEFNQSANPFIQTSIPEPVSMGLLGVGLAGLGVMRRRRQ